ncbi:MAG: nitroreductase family protein [Bacillota bacterium]
MLDTIFHRVSVRKYEDRPVETEKTEWMLKAAMAAPSAVNQQPWEFYVVTNKKVIESLSQVTPYAGCAGKAPAVIAAAYREACPFPDYAQIDLAIAMENLWLAADALGLGGVWLGIAPTEAYMKKVGEMLAFPEGLKAFGLFAYGYPAESRPQQDRFDRERIHYIE